MVNTVGQYRNRLDNTEDRLQRMKYHIFSTYRVCTLGAHVDHQHGLVTGFAIDKGVDLGLDVSEGSKAVLDSETFFGHVEFDIVSPALVKQGDWGDYAWAPCSRCRKDSSCREASPVLSRAQSPWADCHRARAALTSEASTQITKRSRNTGSESEKVGFGLGGAWVTWLWRSVDLCTHCVRKYT